MRGLFPRFQNFTLSQLAGTVDYRHDQNPSRRNLINQPPAVHENLAQLVPTRIFRDATALTGLFAQPFDAVKYAPDNGPCVKG